MKATAIANSNIAFVKYWGKKDSSNVPMNPSISMSLDGLQTKTTIEFSRKYLHDVFILNNKPAEGKKLSRVKNFVDLIRNNRLCFKIVTINNFPTGTGIASSASGFAALAAALNKVYRLKLNHEELSSLARQGSGSAARSIHGGFVEWSGESSKQLYDEEHWPQLRDIIVILSEEEKKISSREGMNLTVKKSKHYKTRIKNISKTIISVKESLQKKNFEELAKNIMKDSDDMHRCINEAGINYLNDKSKETKKLVNFLNKKNIKTAYSFDAGPNAHIITLEKHIDEVKKELIKLNPIQIIIAKPGQGIRYTEEHLF